MPEYNSLCLKTKLQNTCEKYNKGHVPYKLKKTINQLSRNKEDTDRGVVLMGRTKYTKKCSELLQTNHL